MKAGTKVIVVKDFDTAPYAATCAGICETNRVGLRGVVGEHAAPPGKTCVVFFCGDLGYEAEGTRDEPEEDDLLELFIPTDVLDIL